ncbi:MAG: nuclear transport factor 2 family protein [Actinobacteria bacterium]|nr:nuclear transport factor 2 family protein [Actinomycetota bacterium]
MDAAGFARAWAEAWARAWRTHDAELVGTRYAHDAVFRSQPFRPAHEGAEGAAGYAAWAFEDEREAEVWFAEPRVVGDEAAAVEHWGISTGASGAVETIAGAALLRFGPDGRVVEQRDYWSSREGSTEPYEGWARS